MEDKDLQQENKKLKSKNEQLQSKLDAIEKSKQRKSKVQLCLGRIGLGFVLGAGLKSSMHQLYKELPNQVKKNTLADVTTHVIWRITRIGLFGALIALIPTLLLWQQNKLLGVQNQKLEDQTKLFEKQNEKIDNQIQLEESNRRGALIVMMSNIMDKVDDELTNDWNDDKKRNLSPQLIGRISALSQSFRPYRFWQDSSLIEKPLSPERGQLLLALANSAFDSLAYVNIYRNATFEDSYLHGANLHGANLSGANLREADLLRADLRGAILRGTDLSRVSFIAADLSGANLSKANLSGANLSKVNLSKADLSGANLVKANFRGANLSGANLSKANLYEANLSRMISVGADFRGARFNIKNIKDPKDPDLSRSQMDKTDLSGVDLSRANLSGVSFIKADLSGANLSGADLRESYLNITVLSGADLSGAYLKKAKVKNKNWLEKTEVLDLDLILAKYEVDTTLQKDHWMHYYLIKEKPKEGGARNGGR